MPDLNGIEATRQITHEFPAVKVVALSVHDNRAYVINMLKSGASGYLLKDCASQELVNAIRLVAIENKIYLSPAITDIVVNNFAAFAEVMRQP
jgi:two-component system response regulator NreC